MRDGDYDVERSLDGLGRVTRRDFLTFCSGIAAALGLPAAAGPKIAAAATAPARPPVIWLSGQECTGCSETLLRATHPTLETLILDAISLDYHEALSTPAGRNAEDARQASMAANEGKFVLVIEGAIPTKDGGIYCKIGDRTMLEHVQETAEKAAAIISIGSCASWGGVPSTTPNPTGATGAPMVLPGKTVVTIPGCPPNPYNFLATVLQFITFGTLPALDELGRPKFAYGRLVHENCERRAHFDAGRFALQFGDPGHRQGWCLYKLGCKGPETYANCPAILFGDTGAASWPVGTGHPCIGCTEKGIVFEKGIHQLADLKTVAPPVAYPRIAEDKGTGITPGAAALAAGAVGVAVGAGAVLAAKAGHLPSVDDSRDDQGGGSV